MAMAAYLPWLLDGRSLRLRDLPRRVSPTRNNNNNGLILLVVVMALRPLHGRRVHLYHEELQHDRQRHEQQRRVVEPVLEQVSNVLRMMIRVRLDPPHGCREDVEDGGDCSIASLPA